MPSQAKAEGLCPIETAESPPSISSAVAADKKPHPAALLLGRRAAGAGGHSASCAYPDGRGTNKAGSSNPEGRSWAVEGVPPRTCQSRRLSNCIRLVREFSGLQRSFNHHRPAIR